MLARSNRLRLGRDIDRVYRQGRYGRGEFLAAKVSQRSSGNSRAAVIVGKKVSKQAVVRNRIRRRLSELLAAKWQQIAPGCDIVVTVYADASEVKSELLDRDLAQALRRAGALTASAKE